VSALDKSVNVYNFKRQFQLSRGCGPSQKSRYGDRLTLQVTAVSNGTFSSTLTGSLTLLSQNNVSRALTGLCAGEKVVLKPRNQDNQTYFVTVEVIMRVLKQSPDIKANKGDFCKDKNVVKSGDKIKIKTRARIPNLIYIFYPHPTGNIPITVKQRGTPGTTVDNSIDDVKTGEGQLLTGWEAGILGACKGEIRRIMISPARAFGEKGVHRKIPPNVPLALDVEIMSVEERDPVFRYLQQSANGELFNFAP